MLFRRRKDSEKKTRSFRGKCVQIVRLMRGSYPEHMRVLKASSKIQCSFVFKTLVKVEIEMSL